MTSQQFIIKGKVALVTGATGGIGSSLVFQLLKNGIKGITLVDVDEKKGADLLEKINSTYGKGTAIFVKADISDKEQFEEAFKKTVVTFNNIDILINNAAVFDDKNWEREFKININGSFIGTSLGLETYLRNYKTSDNAVIINVSSVGGLMGFSTIPGYVTTKFAVVGMVKSWGSPFHYQRTKVRVVGLCPGGTQTEIFLSFKDNIFNEEYRVDSIQAKVSGDANASIYQSPENVAKETMKIISSASNGSLWVVSGGLPAFEHVLAPVDIPEK